MVNGDIISKLPPVIMLNPDGTMAVVNKLITGEDLLKKDPEAKDTKGEPIKYDKMYSQPKEPLYMNHEKNVAKAYKEGGWPKVQEYCESVNKIMVERQERAKLERESKLIKTEEPVEDEKPN